MDLATFRRTGTAYEMDATSAAKFLGPFTISYTMADGTKRTRTATWRAMQTVLPVIGRVGDRGSLHSIEVLDRYGNDQTFSSDVLPLMEDVTVRTAPHGHPGHDGNPGTCAACHAEEFGA